MCCLSLGLSSLSLSPQRWGSSVDFLSWRERRFKGGGEGSRGALLLVSPEGDGPGVREAAAEANQPPEPAHRGPPVKGEDRTAADAQLAHVCDSWVELPGVI